MELKYPTTENKGQVNAKHVERSRMQLDRAVYAELTQTELNAQYDQTSKVPNAADYAANWRQQSDLLVQRMAVATHNYGSASCESVALIGTGQGPLHMHIHGGAWRALSKEDAIFTAAGLAVQGTRLAVLDFGLAPDTPLPTIVDQVRRAFLRLRSHIAEGAPITVSGHSSGAHLAACLLDKDWWVNAGIGPKDFAGFVLASGPYDLEPVRLSARNTYLRLSSQEAARYSPAGHLPSILPPVAIYWGEEELPEFVRQSRVFAKAVSAINPGTVAHELQGLNHFDVYDTFGDATSPVCAMAQSMSDSARRPRTDSETGRNRR